jgi:hypothetical protein
MLVIKTVLVPFRMSLSAKQPISLRTEITNTSDVAKKVSIKFLVSKDLSVEKSGLANIVEKKIGSIEPGETKLFYLDVFTKTQTVVRDYPARLLTYEHYSDYDYIDKEYKKDFTVKVEK